MSPMIAIDAVEEKDERSVTRRKKNDYEIRLARDPCRYRGLLDENFSNQSDGRRVIIVQYYSIQYTAFHLLVTVTTNCVCKAPPSNIYARRRPPTQNIIIQYRYRDEYITIKTYIQPLTMVYFYPVSIVQYIIIIYSLCGHFVVKNNKLKKRVLQHILDRYTYVRATS